MYSFFQGKFILCSPPSVKEGPQCIDTKSSQTEFGDDDSGMNSFPFFFSLNMNINEELPRSRDVSDEQAG